MTIVDIGVIVVMLVSSIMSFRLGLIRVILALSGWVGSAIATVYFFPDIRPYTHQWISNELVADITAGTAIFIVTMVFLTILSQAISGFVRRSPLSFLDRTCGLLAGLLIGAILVSSGYMFSIRILDIPPNALFLQEARSLPLLRQGANTISSFIPQKWGILLPEPKSKIRPDAAFRNLLIPKTESDDQLPLQGYKSQERKDMDRLIRSHK